MGHSASPTHRWNDGGGRGPIRAAALAFGVALAVASLPVPAAAQQDRFVDHLIGFHSQLSGTYGDEGPRAAAHLEQMADSLASWDRVIDGIEMSLAAEVADAPPDRLAKVRITLASMYMERGRFDDALRELDAVLELAPPQGQGALHFFRGLVHEAAGRPVEALDAFRRAWALDPDDPVKAYVLADRTRRQVDRADLDPAGLQPYTEALLAARRRAGTRAGLPSEPFVRLTLIRDEAAHEPVFAPALYAEGFELLARGRYREAIARLQAATAGDPLFVDEVARTASMTRGIADLRAGRIEAAVEHLEAAVTARPASSEGHRILGDTYAALGRHASAVEHLDTAVRLAPDDERARVALARALGEAGEWERARAVLEDTIAALPDSAEAHWALAGAYEALGRGPDAIRALEAATAFVVPAGKGQLYWRLADLYHRHQRFERVVVALAERARLIPNAAAVYADLGLAYTRLGRADEALLDLAMSSLLAPDNAETLAAIGQIHVNAERYAAAEAVLRRALAIEPDLPQVHYALGTTLIRLGRADEARTHLTRFRRLRAESFEQQQRAFDAERRRRATSGGR